MVRQLGRRNLDDYNRKIAIGKKYELEKKIFTGWAGVTETEESISRPQNEATTYEQKEISHDAPEEPPERTRERIAKELGISKSTVERANETYKAHQAIREEAPDIADKLISGKIKALDEVVRPSRTAR